METPHQVPSPGPAIPEPVVPEPPKPATIGELFAQLSLQVSTLIQGEIELTKTKAQAFAKKVGAGGALLFVAAVLCLYLLGWFFHLIEVALTYAVPAWAAALIVLLIIAIIIAILAFVGMKLIEKGQQDPPAPKEGVKKSVEAFKKGLGE